MSVKWQKVKLGEICSSVSDGDHLAPPKTDVGIPFVTISDIKDNRFDLSHTRFVSEEYYQRIDEKRKVHRGDVLYSVVGSYGIPVFADTDLKIAFQRHIAILRPSERLCPKFLYYSLKNPKFYKSADGAAVGSAQKTISLSSLRRLEIDVPSLPVQKKIASILSAYDDLIENNRRRIAILEEMARKVYRKRFGGKKANGKFFPLSEVAEVCYGKDHKAIEDGDIPIFGSGGVMRYGNRAICDQVSVLIPRKGSIGNVMYCDEPFWTVDTMFYTRFKFPNMAKILYYQLCAYDLSGLSTGSAVPSMTTDILNALRIFVPDDELREKFEAAVGVLFTQKQVLIGQNKTLAAARDVLLPKVMGGRFDCILPVIGGDVRSLTMG